MRLELIAQSLGCRLEGDPNTEITGVAGIEEADDHQITFVSNRKYARHARTTGAGAIIVEEAFPALETPTLRTPNPYLTFARAIELFYQPPEPVCGIHPSAVVAASARIGAAATSPTS